MNTFAGWPVDGHVHFHSTACVAATLDSAARNFRRIGMRRIGLLGALLLAQAARERVFEEIEGGASLGGWRIEPVVAEPQSLIARNADCTIAVICGRQVRTQGGLEVLALGTRTSFGDDASFADTVSAVQRSGAFAVIPWGFGKWFGRRGRQVEETLRAHGARTLAVGDNGSRLATWPVPSLIARSSQAGFHVIPGTDPFPFGGDHRRVGSFGFQAPSVPDERTPWQALHLWLQALDQSPPPFGRALNPFRFVVNQFGIQLHNRFSWRGTP